MTYESESIKIKECYLMLATCVRWRETYPPFPYVRDKYAHNLPIYSNLESNNISSAFTRYHAQVIMRLHRTQCYVLVTANNPFHIPYNTDQNYTHMRSFFPVLTSLITTQYYRGMSHAYIACVHVRWWCGTTDNLWCGVVFFSYLFTTCSITR
jgi:hypothetical protein